MQHYPGRSAQRYGLYDPSFEHDSCGVSFVAHLKGVASRQLVDTALTALTNLDHRGATGAEPDTGDGAGILVQVPDRFLRAELGDILPPAGQYAVGLAFLPVETLAAEKAEAAIENILDDEGLHLVAWRDVPVRPDCLGVTARSVMPRFRQLFVTDPEHSAGIALDRKTFIVRKRIEHELEDDITTLPAVAVRPHAGVQGDADDAAARRVLPRLDRRAL